MGKAGASTASKKGRTLELVARLAAPECTSLAPAADGVAYAAYDRGILRLDLTTRATMVVEPASNLTDAALGGFRWIRWYRGSLVAIQGAPEGPFRLVRLRLDDLGRRVRSVDVLDANVAVAGATSATLSGSTVYYVSPAGAQVDGQLEIKKLALK